MFEQLQGLSNQIAAAKAELQAKAKEVVAPALKEFMEKNPKFTAICWAQYTPYFNDGDPCTFRMGEVAFTAGEDTDDGPYGEGWHDSTYGEPEAPFDAADYAAIDELGGAISGMEDEMQTIFGDHVKVIVTKDGVTTEEYEHD